MWKGFQHDASMQYKGNKPSCMENKHAVQERRPSSREWMGGLFFRPPGAHSSISESREARSFMTAIVSAFIIFLPFFNPIDIERVVLEIGVFNTLFLYGKRYWGTK